MTRERVLKLPVLEIFGPTFQGEGRAIGQKTMFVRTAGCDYHCDWCDSAFTWDGSEKPTRMTSQRYQRRFSNTRFLRPHSLEIPYRLRSRHADAPRGAPRLRGESQDAP